VPNSGYAVGSLHERSSCRADPTMTISYTRHPLLSSRSVSPWKSTAPRSYRSRLPKPSVGAIIEPVQGERIMEKQPNSRMCFVCGINNPIGLKLKFYTDDEGRCIARFQPKPEHQGYPGQLHGGIISTLLDEPTQISLHSGVLAV